MTLSRRSFLSGCMLLAGCYAIPERFWHFLKPPEEPLILESERREVPNPVFRVVLHDALKKEAQWTTMSVREMGGRVLLVGEEVLPAMWVRRIEPFRHPHRTMLFA